MTYIYSIIKNNEKYLDSFNMSIILDFIFSTIKTNIKKNFEFYPLSNELVLNYYFKIFLLHTNKYSNIKLSTLNIISKKLP